MMISSPSRKRVTAPPSHTTRSARRVVRSVRRAHHNRPRTQAAEPLFPCAFAGSRRATAPWARARPTDRRREPVHRAQRARAAHLPQDPRRSRPRDRSRWWDGHDREGRQRARPVHRNRASLVARGVHHRRADHPRRALADPPHRRAPPARSQASTRRLAGAHPGRAGARRRPPDRVAQGFVGLFACRWLKTQGIDDALIQPYSGHESRTSLEIYSPSRSPTPNANTTTSSTNSPS